MRTTLNIDDAILTEAKELAAREGKSLSIVINDKLRTGFAKDREPKRPAALKPLVTFRGAGVRPGVNLDSNSETLDIMEGLE